MTAESVASTRRVKALALKLAAWLVLTGVVIATALVFAISWLAMSSGAATRPHLSEHGGETLTGIAAILAFTIAVATVIVFAVTLSILSGVLKTDGGSPEIIQERKLRCRRKTRSFVILAAGALFLASVLGLRWSRSVQAGLPAVDVEREGGP